MPTHHLFTKGIQLTVSPFRTTNSIILISQEASKQVTQYRIPDFLRRFLPLRYLLHSSVLALVDLLNSFYTYSDMSKDEFVAWWLETEFGRKKRLHWSGNRTAACWQHFDQVSNAKTGKPGAKCRQCHKVLDHPANGRYGTTALHRHLAGPTCRKSTRQKTNIKGLLISAVCLSQGSEVSF